MYKRCRLGMGYLPQESSVFRKLTVEENLLAILETLDLSHQERMTPLPGAAAAPALNPLAPRTDDAARGAARRARPDPSRPAQGLHPVRGRAAAARDHAGARDQPPLPAARRAVHPHRFDPDRL